MHDDVRGGRAVKRRTWNVDRVIGIPKVLFKLRGHRSRPFARMSTPRRTWYTVPPPLRRLIQGIPRVSDAARLTSFQGF